MSKTINILLVNHGRFGEELIKSVEMITGPLTEIEAVSLTKGMSIEDLILILDEKIVRMSGEIIILVDLFGGTPSNVAMMMQRKHKVNILCGMNLPMLLELVLNRDHLETPLNELIRKALDAGKQAILQPASICLENEFEG